MHLKSIVCDSTEYQRTYWKLLQLECILKLEFHFCQTIYVLLENVNVFSNTDSTFLGLYQRVLWRLSFKLFRNRLKYSSKIIAHELYSSFFYLKKLILEVLRHFTTNWVFGKVSQQTGNFSQHQFAVKWQFSAVSQFWECLRLRQRSLHRFRCHIVFCS